MNIFADFQSRIAGLLEKRIAGGELPRGLDLGRFVVEPPREAAHGDLSTNAAMVYAREAKEAGSNPRALAASLAADLAREPDVLSAEAAGPGFINIVLKPEVYHRGSKRDPHPRRALRGRGAERGGAGQRRICERQPDRADARRPCARGGVRRRPREPPDLFRPRGHARILCQRRRRPGRRPGALGLPPLPRGFGRGHRPDPRGPLSRRLSETGRRRIWRASSARRSRTSPRRNGCQRRASAPSTR